MSTICVLILLILKMVAAEFDPDIDEKFLTMPSDEFVEYFNKQNFSWTMSNYDVDYPLCNVDKLENRLKLPVQENDEDFLKDLPENFDPREKWPHCDSIKEINNQGQCGSCWAFGTANVASDRTCIYANVSVKLAEQDLECCITNVCEGGSPVEAFEFWRTKGLVTKDCKPYDIEKLKENKCNLECVDKNKSYRADKHFAEKIYAVKENLDDIKAELFHNGPVEAIFTVFKDFPKYKSGVYVRKSNVIEGFHSVRVLGYGIENGLNYWLVANSWGPEWGENGLFRIKAFQEDINIEMQMTTGIPKQCC